MLNLKKLLTKVLEALNVLEIENGGDYTSSLINATVSSPWKCPMSGIMTTTAGTNSGVTAYWYVLDKTDNVGVSRAVRAGTSNYQLGDSFPVIQGHEYYSQTSGLTTTRSATLYKIIGGGTS